MNRHRALAVAVFVSLALLADSCGATARGGIPAPADHPAGVGVARASSLPSGASVFVIVLENLSYDKAMQLPALGRLARDYGVATDYHGVTHPSLPNYLALTSGSTFGITDDAFHRLPVTGIGDQLSQHRIPWRAYMDGMSKGCMDSPSPYVVKHNPFAYYGGSCPPNVVPLDDLPGDLHHGTPRFVWITPNACNDGHDCAPETADHFADEWSARIMASEAWKRGGVLYIAWDEADGEGANGHGDTNRVACLVVAPHLVTHRVGQLYDHYSLLATMEDQLGVPRTGKAVGVDAMSAFFQSG